MNQSVVDRFLAKVKKEECWIWMAAKNSSGLPYGQFKFGNSMKLAHRVSYELFVENIPKGMLVCHKCDNPECVNPDHLFLGNHSDNNLDCVSKKRHKSSATSKCPKGHEYDIEIRMSSGRPQRACSICRRSAVDKYQRKIYAAGKNTKS